VKAGERVRISGAAGPARSATAVSLPAEMLGWAEGMARDENRTMSELVRKALRVYQRERQAWQDVFAYGEANAKRLGVRTEEDVVRMVREHRRQKKGDAVSRPKTGPK
jgi:hypothetical protein